MFLSHSSSYRSVWCSSEVTLTRDLPSRTPSRTGVGWTQVDPGPRDVYFTHQEGGVTVRCVLGSSSCDHGTGWGPGREKQEANGGRETKESGVSPRGSGRRGRGNPQVPFVSGALGYSGRVSPRRRIAPGALHTRGSRRPSRRDPLHRCRSERPVSPPADKTGGTRNYRLGTRRVDPLVPPGSCRDGPTIPRPARVTLFIGEASGGRGKGSVSFNSYY